MNSGRTLSDRLAHSIISYLVFVWLIPAQTVSLRQYSQNNHSKKSAVSTVVRLQSLFIMKLFAVCLAAAATTAAPTNSDILDWGNVSWIKKMFKEDVFVSPDSVLSWSCQLKIEHKIINFDCNFQKKTTLIRCVFFGIVF